MGVLSTIGNASHGHLGLSKGRTVVASRNNCPIWLVGNIGAERRSTMGRDKMSKEKASKDPGGQQPEFLRGLEAATQSGGKKPADQSMRATSRTSPKPSSLDKEEGRAAEILKRNAAKDTGTAS